MKLFRAVSRAEHAQIVRTKTLQIVPGSLEGNGSPKRPKPQRNGVNRWRSSLAVYMIE